jgi:hypothetical protein
LYCGFSAAIQALAAQQYPSGCYDEWYKGERGFAATAFTTIAFGLAHRTMAESVEAADRERLAEIVLKAGDWLLSRDDLVKTNHEAAAASALAFAGEMTGNDLFFQGARSKVEHTLASVTDEGWFPEISGMDLGYCSITLDYLMLYQFVTGDDVALAAMQRLFSFMIPHIHPDGTISPEAGTCRSPYVSRLGIGLLSRFDETASRFVSALDTRKLGRVGLKAALADDLRFARWSHIPIAVDLLRDHFTSMTDGIYDIASLYPAGWTFREQAKIAAYHDDKLHVFFNLVSDGSVRCYVEHDLALDDRGPMIGVQAKFHGALGYNTERAIQSVEGGYEVSIPLAETHYFFPSFVLRLLLRLGSVTALSSRYVRAAIDVFRKSKKIALNQSSSGFSGDQTSLTLHRRIVTRRHRVELTDIVTAANGQLPAADVDWRLFVKGRNRKINHEPSAGRRALCVKKVLDVRGGDVEFSFTTE